MDTGKTAEGAEAAGCLTQCNSDILVEWYCWAVTFGTPDCCSRPTDRDQRPPRFRPSFTIMAHIRAYVLSTWRFSMSVKSALGIGLSAMGFAIALVEPASAAEKSRVA